MESNAHEQLKKADSDEAASLSAVVPPAFFAVMVWPLMVLQKNCFAFSQTRAVPRAFGILVGLAYAWHWVPRWRELGFRMKGADKQKPLTREEAVLPILFLGLMTAVWSGVFCSVVIGDLVRFSSHTMYDYDATVLKVTRSKQECRLRVDFNDPALQDDVTQCVQKFDDVRPGARVSVQALSGPFGVRFLSVKRALSG